MNKVNILGVNVDMYTIPQAADKIMEFLGEERMHIIYTPNSEIIMAAYRDAEFCELLNNADMLTADGIGVVYASKILGRPISERAAGFDISCMVLDRVKDTPYSVFLFGGKPGVAEEAAVKLSQKYPGLKIAGTCSGYFGAGDEADIVRKINESGAQLLFVCLGAPKQEKWIAAHAAELTGVRAAIGAGGSLDVFAGRVERAPEFFCKTGLEWFYRLCKEPWRAKRMADLPKFAVTVLAKGRKFPQEQKERS